MSDIMQALRDGADGVGIFACHKGECDFESGNYAAERHLNAVKFMLAESGFNPDRVGIYFMSAAEIDRYLNAVTDLVTRVGALPVNPLKSDNTRGLTISSS